MFHGDICTVSIITWGLDKYGHFNDVILNWHQVYSIGGATHTCAILIIAHVPMLFYVKKLLNTIEESCRLHEWQYYMPACFGQVQPKKWIIRLFFSILVVVCSGLWWFVMVCLHRLRLCLWLYTTYGYRCKGDLWWFAAVSLISETPRITANRHESPVFAQHTSFCHGCVRLRMVRVCEVPNFRSIFQS